MTDLHSAGTRPARGLQLDSEGRFSYEGEIGRGSYGVVVAARDNDTPEKQVVAIKLFEKNNKLHISRVIREIRNLQRLDHPHVVKFKDVVKTETHIGIVMEYVPNGNLEQYMARLGGLSERLVRFFFQQIVVAVDYCHGERVFNRDIKVENILVTGENEHWPMLKICDFGFSKWLTVDSLANSQVGTGGLLAPEVLDLPPGGTYDGYKADIWCIGLCLYRMVTGRYPFSYPGEDLRNIQVVNRVSGRIRRVEYTIPDGVPKDCANIIRRILVRNPEDRPTIQEIQIDPYFQKSLPDGAMDMNHGRRRLSGSGSLSQERVLDASQTI